VTVLGFEVIEDGEVVEMNSCFQEKAKGGQGNENINVYTNAHSC